MSDPKDEAITELMSAIGQVMDKWKSIIPLAELKEIGVKVVRDYFYFGAEEKQCSKCKCMKHKDLFGADSSKPDGLFAWCSECRSQWYQNKRGRYYNGRV